MIEILYIAGSGRSGSTLLERVLGQTGLFAAVGELRHIWRRDPSRELCGCGVLISECEFWNQVRRRAFGNQALPDFAETLKLQQQVDRMRYIPWMIGAMKDQDYERRRNRYNNLLVRLYSSIVDVSGSNIIVDSSKDISTLYFLNNIPGIRLRILHMIRDSRAVAFSWMREKIRPQVVDSLSYMPIYSPQKSAADWTYRNLFTELADRHGGYLRIRYEDMIADPRLIVRQVFSFADLPVQEFNFIDRDKINLTKDNHTVSGNPMRFQKGEISIKLDNAWQTEMKTWQRAIVTGLTWPMLKKYDYI